MFLEVFLNGPSQFPYVLLFAIHLVAFVPVDYSALLNSGVFYLLEQLEGY